MMQEPTLHRTRRWRAAPPILKPGELLEGGEVLEELSGEVAVLLWKTVRNVTLWAGASPAERRGLFDERAHRERLAEILAAPLPPELGEPLEVIAGMLHHRGTIRREAVSLASLRIAAWADANGATATALSFVQAASLATPADAELAYQVGRRARARAENARSESWYRRAIMLARQSREWSCYTRSYLGLGNLFFQRGNMPSAQRAQSKALRTAGRIRARELQGAALHNLFTIALEMGDHQKALAYAARAHRAYGGYHPRVPALSHDVACLWNDRGEFSRAAPVLQAVLPHFEAAAERLVVLANTARALAGTGDVERFQSTRLATLQLLDLPEAEAGAPQALLNLARGEALLGEADYAISAAEHCMDLARRRGERKVEMAAEAVLASMISGRAVVRTRPAEVAVGSPMDALDGWSLDAAGEDEFAAALIGSLAGSM